MTLTDKQQEELSGEFQRKVGDMVRREVVYCVSGLMDAILPGLVESGEYTEEAMALHYGRTYWVPCSVNGQEGEEFDSEDDAQEWIDEHETVCDAGEWQTDERTSEIFEHWIVTRWLKERLKEKGQIVEDIHGVDVWARTCTGQAILLDGDICEIYREMVS